MWAIIISVLYLFLNCMICGTDYAILVNFTSVLYFHCRKTTPVEIDLQSSPYPSLTVMHIVSVIHVLFRWIFQASGLILGNRDVCDKLICVNPHILKERKREREQERVKDLPSPLVHSPVTALVRFGPDKSVLVSWWWSKILLFRMRSVD